MTVAVIGIGSNSLRMLIAEICHAQVVRVLRDRKGLRVFAALDENKNITPEMMKNAAQSILQFVQKAQELQVDKIHLFATSAVRDAKNQGEFCVYIEEGTGLSLEICSGEMEAMLSFLGAGLGDSAGVIDIGGGSTEIVLGHRRKITYSKSLQMGAVRFYREYPIFDAESAQLVVNHAKNLLIPEKKHIDSAGTMTWTGVGGTFTAAAALSQNISWMDKERIHGYVITHNTLLKSMERIAPMCIEERNALPSIHPQRADILVHGMAILLACMEVFRISELTASEYGNLEGYLKYHYT